MTRDEAQRAVEAGIEVAVCEMDRGADVIGTGDMGIGNTTPSSAIVAAFTGRPVAEVTGAGTGWTTQGWRARSPSSNAGCKSIVLTHQTHWTY